MIKETKARPINKISNFRKIGEKLTRKVETVGRRGGGESCVHEGKKSGGGEDLTGGEERGMNGECDLVMIVSERRPGRPDHCHH
ncbi:hypothetical protein SLEP1_g25344 [Rubroshorea leprosula]|uniref:Uncharacterized protein n=1 Tax=Rubroshorea leprosula TaxID=152421 RepID=A0AAV5JIU9_9ROSI|nr:hypothetical protein SLEP1_g25344 [Rubroshorea leprosula]